MAVVIGQRRVVLIRSLLCSVIAIIAIRGHPAQAAVVYGGSGYAVTFDGNAAFHNRNFSWPTTEFTLAFWLRTSDDYALNAVASFALSDARANNVMFEVLGTLAVDEYAYPHMAPPVGVVVTDGQWHHHAIAWRKSDCRAVYFVDGVAGGNLTAPAGTPCNVGGPGMLVIGQEQDGFGKAFEINEAFAGQLDEWRLYNKALTAAEITAAMSSVPSNPSAVASLAAYYDFDAGASSSTADRTGKSGPLVAGFPAEALASSGQCGASASSSASSDVTSRHLPVWAVSDAPVAGGSLVVRKLPRAATSTLLLPCRDDSRLASAEDASLAPCCEVTLKSAVTGAGGGAVAFSSNGTTLGVAAPFFVCPAVSPIVLSGFNGGANGDRNSSFVLTVRSAADAALSAASVDVTFVVVPNAIPVGRTLNIETGDSQSVDIRATSDTASGTFQLGIYDPDGDYGPAVFVTSLPLWGFLYQAGSSAGSLGAVISSVPTKVTLASSKIVYVPSPNQGIASDAFTFCVVDAGEKTRGAAVAADCAAGSNGTVRFAISGVNDMARAGGFGLALDGVDDQAYFNLTSPLLLSAYNATVGMWVHLPTNGPTSGEAALVRGLAADASSNVFELGLLMSSSGGTVRLRFGATAQNLTMPKPIPVDTWTYIAVTISRNSGGGAYRASLFMGNASVVPVEGIAVAVASLSSTQLAMLALGAPSTSFPFVPKIDVDELSVWNASISAAALNVARSLVVTFPPTPTERLYWPLAATDPMPVLSLHAHYALNEAGGRACVETTTGSALGLLGDRAAGVFIRWPARTASNAPGFFTVRTDEDTAVAITCPVVDSEGAYVTAQLFDLPQHGQLYQLDASGRVSTPVDAIRLGLNDIEIGQWVSSIGDYSSQWGTSVPVNTSTAHCFCAQSMIGEPGCGYQFGDCGDAWSGKTARSSLNGLENEWFVVKFARAVYVTRIEIHVNLGSDFVEYIQAIDPRGIWRTLWSGKASTVPGTKYTIFHPRICDTPFAADTIRVQINTEAVPDQWEEIDAVRLYGLEKIPSAILANYDRQLIYVPSPDFNGVDSFSYVASDCGTDAERKSAPFHVTINVNPINDAPTISLPSSSATVYAGLPTRLQAVIKDVDGQAVTTRARASSPSLVLYNLVSLSAATDTLGSPLSSTDERVLFNGSVIAVASTCGTFSVVFTGDDLTGRATSVSQPTTLTVVVPCVAGSDDRPLRIGVAVGVPVGFCVVFTIIVVLFLRHKRQVERASRQWVVRFDELEFGPKLGAGGFGTVYSGKWRGTRVAIKTIRLGDDDLLQSQALPNPNQSRIVNAVTRTLMSANGKKGSGDNSNGRRGSVSSIFTRFASTVGISWRSSATSPFSSSKGVMCCGARQKHHASDSRRAMANAFLDEIKVMCNLRHPHVLLFMGASVAYPKFALITEVMPRGDLWGILQSSMELDVPMRLRFIADAASGMQYLHSRSPPLLHCDMKAANLLVSDQWTVKVSDFGLSQFKGLSSSRRIIGSIYWIAPEILQGSAGFTEKADVYSFSIVMSEIFLRTEPYADYLDLSMDPKIELIAERICEQGVRPVIPQYVSQDCLALMKRCWTDHYVDRPDFDEIQATVLALDPGAFKADLRRVCVTGYLGVDMCEENTLSYMGWQEAKCSVLDGMFEMATDDGRQLRIYGTEIVAVSTVERNGGDVIALSLMNRPPMYLRSEKAEDQPRWLKGLRVVMQVKPGVDKNE